MTVPTMGTAAPPVSGGGFSASTPARSSGGTGEDFAGLVAGMLDQSQQPGSDAGTEAGAGSGGQTQTEQAAAADASPGTPNGPEAPAVSPDSAAGQSPAIVLTVAVPANAPRRVGGAAPGGADTSSAVGTSRSAAGVGTPVATAASAAGTTVPGAVPATGGTASDSGRPAVAAGETATAAQHGVPGAGESGEPQAAASAVADTGTTGGRTTADTGAPTAPLSSTSSTGFSAVATAPTATSTAATGSAEAGPVGGQVFPEVARLVTRGDGTQRLTLRLSPENLGEVRIVVTVRDGAVDVSLAAGGQAQEALLHGSPELRRLLESMGAASTQIAVRDLPSATQQPGGGAASAGTSGLGPGDGDRSGDDPSAQRHTSGGHHPAGHPTATSRSGSTDPTTQASASGVDLRL
ncbi:MAG TPA: flagellar hook-length control protein FliK [Nocardioidaceae bacterium]|nr:flagellar hook-length control protein FliK [Nocardioidaceae bacterium]